MVLIPLLTVLPLIAFYLWMFNDMLNNDFVGQPPLVASPASSFKYNWTFDFIVLNVFAAGLYLVSEYRQRRH